MVQVKVLKKTFFLRHVRIRWSGPDLRHILLDSGAPEGPPPLCALWPLRVIAARGRCRGHLSPLASPPAKDAAVDGVRRLRSSVGLGRPIGCQLIKGRKEPQRHRRNLGTFGDPEDLNIFTRDIRFTCFFIILLSDNVVYWLCCHLRLGLHSQSSSSLPSCPLGYIIHLIKSCFPPPTSFAHHILCTSSGHVQTSLFPPNI